MRKTRKSSLFLIELIIAILFFSLSAAVCVRLFAASYLTSRESAYRDTATLQAQSMAALFCAADGELDSLLSYASAAEASENVYLGSVMQDGEAYAVTLTVTPSDTAPALTIAITAPDAAADAAPLVLLETMVYLPLQVEEVAE